MRPVSLLIALFCLVGAGCSTGLRGTSDFDPGAAAASLQACLDEVAGRKLQIGQSNDRIPVLPKPAKGVAFADPVYGTCVVRATNHWQEPPEGFARNDYARRQAFNADNTMFFVYALDGYWHLYSAVTFAWLGELSGPVADAEPQWHPTDPNRLYYLPNVGAGMVVYELNVQTGASRDVARLASRLQARWPAANAAWTRGEGAPSRDARYWAFLVDDADFEALGFVVWDREQDDIVGWLDTNERPDHLSMSPSGRHVVVSWGDRVVVYDRNLGNPRQIFDRTEHSDIAVGADGQDIFVSIDYGANDGDVFMVDLETGARTNLLPTYLNGTATAMHFSGKAYDRPGWVLVSTYANTTTTQEWLHDKIFALELKANPRVVPLAHHHGIDKGYWTEPHASVNRDFSRVLFNSNWNNADAQDVDAYFLRIPPGAFPD